MNTNIHKEDKLKLEIYFENQKNSFEERLKEIKLPKDQEEKIVASKTVKTIRDKTLGLFKVGEIVNTILNWNEEIDSEIKEAKKQFLLATYFDKIDHNEESINNILRLLTNPTGNTLFNKIVRILDNTPPDAELTNHLASVLKKIINSDFEILFDEHKFILHQIEFLSPHSLSLLCDYNNWPGFKFTGSISGKGHLLAIDWYINFSKSYAAFKNYSKPEIEDKLAHSINELTKNGFVEGKSVKGENNTNGKAVITPYWQINFEVFTIILHLTAGKHHYPIPYYPKQKNPLLSKGIFVFI